mmetsp:Transcript_33399/g.34030  ORF Transcript_33399/g.34030 Transcript_33399/m.34030 type:complete len:442 (-) Transcript_33399:195-1520(-)|eukprot:CAMPEP_0182430112 /NCGR_PEP_ID=MMETSP1167-20130531/37039_1 /TAXON_ID=2988 /ORGANISM="Mallomonas Sp, Strain CCMP3275" /LENGTH=441 /DNA_ID=CAMNT_0024614795 /DNA_START=21 /DNA_END=1346 /DNA_ORIENTATION=-
MQSFDHVEGHEEDISEFVGFHQKSQMPHGLSDMTANVFPAHLFTGDNEGARIYIAGGCSKDQFCYPTGCYCSEITNALYYFAPEVDKWYTNLPAAPTARYRHMSAVVNNKLYLLGGRHLNDSLIYTVDIFDPVQAQWQASIRWNNPTSDGGAFSVGDKLYVVGGYDQYYTASNTTSGVAQFHMLDTSTNLWNTSLPQLPTPRGDLAVQELDGRFYVLGGWGGWWVHAIKTVESFDPVSVTWRSEPGMHFGRGDMAVGNMKNMMFAIGGETKNYTFDPNGTLSVPVPHTYRYTVAAQAWVEETGIPKARFRFTGASYNSSSDPLDSAIYLFGGQEPYNASCHCFRVNSGTIKYYPVSAYSPPSSKSKKLDDGSIAGIVIGVVVAVAVIIVGVLLFLGYRNRRYFMMAEPKENEDAPNAPKADEADSAPNEKGFDSVEGGKRV